MHASLEFAYDCPEQFKKWHETSNSIIVLACANEEELKKIFWDFMSRGRHASFFVEPDIKDQWTSICIEPHEDNKRLLSSLPLAGRIKNESRVTREDIRLKT